jgi:hypothetical protein
VSTQHMRSLTYALHAPDLEDMTSMQVTGSEWVSHVAGIRKLAGALHANPDAPFHPTHSIFHGMVSSHQQTLTSSAGAPLIDDLIQWVESQLHAQPALRDVCRAHPHPERIATQLALGYFLHHQVASNVDFDPPNLFSQEDSLGWDLVRARARRGTRPFTGSAPAEDPDYRFAILQSELYRRYLRLTVERRDVWPLAHYLKRLARGYLEAERTEHVERVVHTLLDRGARGLGLEAAP